MIQKVFFPSNIPTMVPSFKNRRELFVVITVLVGILFAILAAFFIKRCCPLRLRENRQMEEPPFIRNGER